MSIDIFQIDAFTNRVFGGNPAAVCPLENWLPDDVLQHIAIENNLSETAFFIPLPNGNFHLRWFTPEFEMDLCGHATLASAFVLFEELGYDKDDIFFETQSGLLSVRKSDQLLELNFPSRPPQPSELPDIIRQGLNIQPVEVWKARDYLLLYEKEEDIRKIDPNISIINQINIDPGGIIVTAKADAEDIDFVSRLFTPQAGIFEDPVTGSAHCTLIPFWAERFQKNRLTARQISARVGELFCELQGERVSIKGMAVKYLSGTIEVPTTLSV
ncbi:MAG: PhzF family phenazine biosynthesis protein [Bacteroidota bacterium]